MEKCRQSINTNQSNDICSLAILAKAKGKFIRFPGGCLIHGDGLGNYVPLVTTSVYVTIKLNGKKPVGSKAVKKGSFVYSNQDKNKNKPLN